MSSSADHLCLWCEDPAKPILPRGRYCSRRCRQAAWRLGRLMRFCSANAEPGLFGYFDPGYIGLAAKYYKGQPDFRGEVDHPALIQRALASGYKGFALSLSVSLLSLKTIINALPEELLQPTSGGPPPARLCSWRKPHAVPAATRGAHNTWEGLLVVGGRRLAPGIPDSLQALPARGWGHLPGRKPIRFCAWLFNLLGMLPGDELVDVFPGSGAVGRAWRVLSPRTSAALSPETRQLVRQRIQVEPEPEASPAAPRPRRVQLSLLEAASPPARSRLSIDSVQQAEELL